jgi:hypothetical protein
MGNPADVNERDRQAVETREGEGRDLLLDDDLFESDDESDVEREEPSQ